MAPKKEIVHICTKDKDFNQIALNNLKMANSIETIKNSQDRLEKSFDDMKKTNEEFGKKRDEKIDNLITEIREGFVTIKQHEEVKTAFEKFKDKMWAVNFALIVALITAFFKMFSK